MLRSVLGRFWALYLVGFTVQLAVIVAVLVRFFASTNYVAKWLLNSIYDSAEVLGGPVTLGFITDRAVVLSVPTVFNFIIDWAEAISVAAVYIVFIPTFIAIMESRRKQALARVHIWARDAILKLSETSNGESAVKKLEDWENRLHNIIADSDSALADTRAIGNGLKPKVKKAVESLLKLEGCFNNHTEPAELKTLLQTTVIAFKEISTSTYNSLYQSH